VLGSWTSRELKRTDDNQRSVLDGQNKAGFQQRKSLRFIDRASRSTARNARDRGAALPPHYVDTRAPLLDCRKNDFVRRENSDSMKKFSTKADVGIGVAIVESDPLRLAGFRALLENHDELRLTGATLAEIGGMTGIDVVILSKRPNQNLSAMMQHLRVLQPEARVIVTASTSADELVLDALASGAKGYVDESALASEFVNAIRIVNEGLIWASRRALAIFVERSSSAGKRLSGGADFTKREREVLEMLVAGRSNREIAIPLGIEERTVKAHVAKLMRKVGVHNRIMLTVHAVNHCLVAPR